MTDQFSSILPSTVILGTLAVIALILTITRGWADESRMHTRAAVRIAVIAVVSQAAHFIEELLTGFHERFPALFGAGPMPPGFFLSFNVAWLVIWSLCVLGLSTRRRAALFPLWFLGIGCIANGIAHPLFSVLTGEYFPGLVTSPVVGVMGVLLLRHLLLVTRTIDASPGTA